ncbi:MAG TPA: hypothetical protein VMZ53_14125, partial [Kofleriaceae bacterium]|nr:hypothetical protein [Kofleriaceae bacterium]
HADEPRVAADVEPLAVERVVPGEACDDAVIDPVVTPMRDAYLDAQRSACLRDELSAGLDVHALIDTPGFHGVLGGDLALGGRMIVKQAHELSVHVRVVDYAFVQNAVNKVTNTGLGPVVLGAAAGKAMSETARAALVLRVELPFTRDNMDTMRSAAEIGGVMTGKLSSSVTLNARLSALGMHASSLAGSTSRLAFRAGTDVVWQPRRTIGLQAGAELQAGWTRGFDAVLLRAGIHWAIHGGPWRFRSGIGAPIGGTERTNAIVDIAVLHDL